MTGSKKKHPYTNDAIKYLAKRGYDCGELNEKELEAVYDHVKMSLHEKISYWILGIALVVMVPLMWVNNKVIESKIDSIARPDAILYVSVSESSENSYSPYYVREVIRNYTKSCINIGVTLGIAGAIVLILLSSLEGRSARLKFIKVLLPEKGTDDDSANA
ncbi:MAG: hypothetical protein AB7F23_05820 [Phycisphaerae bacterium]|jgi:hypothetical protein